jgi:hypothetical protein
VHTPNLPTYVAADFLRAEVHFADCWNGKDLDSSDHQSHVAFDNGTGCPSTHPVAMAQIHLEYGYRTNEYRADQLVLATGDTTGYGESPMHVHALKCFLKIWAKASSISEKVTVTINNNTRSPWRLPLLLGRSHTPSRPQRSDVPESRKHLRRWRPMSEPCKFTERDRNAIMLSVG